MKGISLCLHSAILPDLPLEEVVSLAARIGYASVEVACWPAGRADRRYAGVTHIDPDRLDGDAAKRVEDLFGAAGVAIGALCYAPNPLSPDDDEASFAAAHLKKVITAAASLRVGVVVTFVGRDQYRSLEDNWPAFRRTWPPLVSFAADHGVKLAIENCPMLFTRDEWPGGRNMAYCPSVWRKMFQEISSPAFGLTYDPSHLVWQHIDYVKPLREFADRIFHVHAKDARIDRDRLDDVGILACPLEYHTTKIPGLGDVNWSRFLAALTDIRYEGVVSVEVEDRAFEHSREGRERALRQSAAYLRQFLAS